LAGLFKQASYHTQIIIAPLPADLNNNSVYDLQDLIISLQICTKSQLLSKPYVDAAINGNSKIALPESIFVLQKLSESD
ncbi:MAG: hypothetical protein OMM_11731, partial [Candidatus Magnetoglobus multicellularis str. Araruama]